MRVSSILSSGKLIATNFSKVKTLAWTLAGQKKLEDSMDMFGTASRESQKQLLKPKCLSFFSGLKVTRHSRDQTISQQN
jgi:hypothetical protein